MTASARDHASVLPRAGVLASLVTTDRTPGGQLGRHAQVLVVRPGTTPDELPADGRDIAVYAEPLPGGSGVRFLPLAAPPVAGLTWCHAGAHLLSNAMLRAEVRRLTGDGGFSLSYELHDGLAEG